MGCRGKKFTYKRLTRLENFLSKRDPFLFPSTVADLGGGSHPPPWPKRNPPKSSLLAVSPLEWPNPQPPHQNRRRLILLQPSNQKPNLTPHWPAPAQSTQTPSPAQEDPKSILATQTETKTTETLAAGASPVPSSEAVDPAPASKEAAAVASPTHPPSAADLWKGFVKEATEKLEPKETPFLLDSGEACVIIPNAIVEKNKKAWDCFILGQFYEEPPARGAVHAIVNGIWSRQRRDITVNKMEGNSFLFRVPCPNARRRILKQSLWQIDGQTMFVAKWSPGIQQVKPELETVPVWLEFTGVPLQFFNWDALKEIAGMVGHPLCLHPATENLTNIEVAKVYTVINPRKPLPEFVNARFESGDTRRIAVSSPWLPSLCSFCKNLRHTITRCKNAPKTCLTCNSVKHSTASCPCTNQSVPSKEKLKKKEGKKPIKSLLPIVGQPPKTGLKPTDKGAKPPARSLNADPLNSMTAGVQSSKKRPPPGSPCEPPPGSLERSGSTGSVRNSSLARTPPPVLHALRKRTV
uniref:DUF4283 domain-containing protein n=1 Tax=Brassica oleracea var. oleracea TaxID=109376 RepID=A0A0D3DBF3_BRAOL